MPLSHKAFAFDWEAFQRSLAPSLATALMRNDAHVLEAFIDAHAAACCDPYEGNPLPSTWRALLETADVQEIGDFALTHYYDPTDDFGLGESWLHIQDTLPRHVRVALLGTPFGPPGSLFDPGRQGSYFQSGPQLRRNTALLRGYPACIPTWFVARLERLAATNCGLYITF